MLTQLSTKLELKLKSKLSLAKWNFQQMYVTLKVSTPTMMKHVFLEPPEKKKVQAGAKLGQAQRKLKLKLV